MKITHFDKLSCQALEREVLEAVKNIAAKHGLSVASGGGTTDDPLVERCLAHPRPA